MGLTFAKGTTIEEAKAARLARIDRVKECLIDNPEGLSNKDLCDKLKLSAPSIRDYLTVLMKDGFVTVTKNGKDRRQSIYMYRQPDDSSADTTPVTKESTTMPEHDGGQTLNIEEIKPALDVVQGDVVLVSSRSGDGQFFRYLVLAPWERKATVIGVITKEHPMFNLNNPRIVHVGVDPKTQDELYVDLSNVCSRGFRQFGDKVMTVSCDILDDVKSALCRYYAIDKADDSVTETQLKTTIKSLRNKLMYMSGEYEAAKKELQHSEEDLESERFNNKNLTDTVNEQKGVIEQLHIDVGDQIAALQELRAKLTESEARNTDLKALVDQLTQEADEHPEYDISYVDKLESKISELVLENEVLKAKASCMDEYLATMKQLTFTAIKKGGQQ